MLNWIKYDAIFSRMLAHVSRVEYTKIVDVANWSHIVHGNPDCWCLFMQAMAHPAKTANVGKADNSHAAAKIPGMTQSMLKL